LYPAALWIGPASERFLGSFNVYAYFMQHFIVLSAILTITGVILGAISSYLAVRRYLHS
ncbi:MAG: hypothetical protein RIQ56_504, partial [Candidatus Parcubacteria bacterium]